MRRKQGITLPAGGALSGVVAALADHPRLGRELVHAAWLPGSPARYADLDPPLPPALAGALAAAGVERLWSHQAEGLAAARRGEDVLVTTPTASGKSLVFQLPVLEEALAGGAGRALFLFPLKALGQDQRAKFAALAAAAGLSEEDAGCAIYDGDTPRAERERIRRRFPRVIVSNPDMLHLAVLASLPGWVPFLAELRWIVLDELHTYRGIFGSHFHHVVSRLLRQTRALGAAPSLVASSATAANADEFAAALTGRRFHRIAASGAPREGRHVLFFQPSTSPYTTALQLFTALLAAGLKTLVFTKARRITELLYSWLVRQEPALARRVASYRAGFLPEERRQIERDLAGGRLDGAIATSALELGIDIGGLDACILVGYPGSVMSTWQRSGRVGRAGQESITALVALPDALDQFLLAHPEELLARPCEPLIVDPANAPVARAHLVCAAAERPLSRREDAAYLAGHDGVLRELEATAELFRSADGESWVTFARRPHRNVGLRGTGASYRVVAGGSEAGGGRLIGTLDGVRALHEGHPGAVYLHFGRQYLVEELDLEERRIRVRPSDVEYFTTPLTEKGTRVLEVVAERHDVPGGSGPTLQAWLARVEVTERVVGYERKRIFGQEVLDRHPLELPPVYFETVALAWAVPPALADALRRGGAHVMGALHAAEHTAISLVPLLALCDRGDLGGISYPFHPQIGCGAVFVYDGHPGGVGIAARAFQDLPLLLGRVAELLERCPCDDGCPSCVQSPKCGNGNRPLDKAGALRLVRLLLGREEVGQAVEEVAVRLEAMRAPAVPSADVEEEEAGWAERGVAPSRAARRDRDAGALDEPPRSGAGKRARRSGAGTHPAQAGGGRDFSPYPASSPVFGLGTALRRGLAALAAAFRRRPSVVALPPGGTVLFDLETLRSAAEVGGWHNAHRMGVAIAVACHLEEGRFEVFGEDAVGRLVTTLEGAGLVVGFNVKRFDYQVLAGYTGIDYGRRLPTLDLLEEIHRTLGFRVGLEKLARATLGVGKTADGLQSLAWVAAGRLDLVEDYCRHDVEVLRDLYLFGRREGHVRFERRGSLLRLPVTW